ncbi:MAG: 2-amino-4-hydroxy-6-hydroxymethyldihydropteridine diphosphokinase, partial [Pseudomonadota bacterium]
MILIGLGSSLSFCRQEPSTIVRKAGETLGEMLKIVGRSRLYSSPAWPDPSDPPFVNAVIAAAEGPAPHALLEALHAIEAGFGRRRSARNAPRTLDLDLLAY